MQIDPTPATIKNPPEQFTGDVWLDPIASPRDEGQGIAWMGSRNGGKREVHPGQTVYCPPGEEHWHGASPDSFMEHLAMIDNADDPATSTTWLEHVSDEEYRAS